jgi:hypothetical protein
MKVFLSAGTLTLWTGLGAAFCFAMIAVLLLFRQPVGGTFSLPNALYVSAGAFALASIVYGFSFPKEDEIQNVSVSVGPFAAVGGAGCMIFAGVMIARRIHAMSSAIPTLVPQADPSQPNFAPMNYGAPTPAPAPTFGGGGFGQPLAPMYMQAPPPYAAPTQASPFAPPSQYAPPAPPAPPPPSPPSSPSLFAPSPFAAPQAPQPPAPAPLPMPPQPSQPIYAAAPPVAQVVIPACPRCATPMLWISARSAWQCTVCPRG